ncbi:ubiquitin-associated protein 2 isoform X1, partial [Clarias magur]
MIYDTNDADFEDKVNQLMEVTGKNQDECMVALHDCNEDVNRAINFLLEGTSDTTSWETVGKKKSMGKDGISSESKENKENREKKGEKESSKARGGANRRGKGASRNRPVRVEENGVESAPVEKGSDRGRRGKGRVSGGRGRGRAPGASRFTAQGMGTFNPADYTMDSGTTNSHADVWESGTNDATDGTVAWRNTLEDWAAEDWTEDVSLSETKVFTPSCAPPAENHITPGQSLDLASLLQKPAGREELENLKPASSQGLGHSLVFTNSHHQPTRNGGTSTGTTSYAHATLSSVLGSGFGELGGPKLGQTAGQQILEQLKGPGLGQLTSSQPPSSGDNSCAPVGGLGGTGMSVPSSSWDIKPPGTQSSASLPSQFSREFKMQPEPSLVLSQLSQRQQSPLSNAGSLPLARQPSPPPQNGLSANQAPLEAFSKAPEPSQTHVAPLPQAPDSQVSSTQHRQIKTQKRRIAPTSKIPSTAVEMPGSADVSGLNVQFGALDFGSESALPDFSQPENCSSEATREAPMPVPQTQSSLYSKPISESLASPVPLLLPLASSDSIYPPPSVPLPSLASSLTIPSAASVPTSTSSSSSCSSSSSSSSVASSAGNSFDCGVAPHSRLTFSQSKESSGPVTNGFNGVRTAAALDSTSSSSTPKPDSPSLGSSTSVAPSAPLSLLPPSVTPHSSTLSSLAPELPSATLPSLSSHVSSGHSSVSALGTSSSLTYTNVDGVSPLTASAVFSSTSVSALSNNSVSSAGSNSLHSAALGLSGNGTTAPSAIRTAPLLSSSTGKAPPNLSQGVPPLLPNQYIMGPGGLLPAYPQIYGYEDLHMLQSRLPMDYYGITFPGPTATLSSRDGSLANNPYSGEVTKFGRGDSTSPAPPTTLSAAHAPQTAQPPQAQSQGQSQLQPQAHHSTQQAFLNPALPPGYSYTGLPYYPGVPGMPSAFQYGPTMFVPPASTKQHGMGLSNPSTPFQQPSGYSQHTFSSGYDDLTQGPTGAEYSKGYSNSSQTQAKSAASGPGKGVSVTSSNSGVPDISGTVYNKTQSFDKQGFHAGTPPPFNLPSALGGTGPLNPGGAPGYAPGPFLHILPAHQQPHSQLLHHHLTQDGQ